MAEKFYITNPIFYPNAELHLGHAYTTTLSDILARYHRLLGDYTYFLAGSDENTEKVVRAAEAAGKDTKTYLNGIVSGFQGLFGDLGISYDQFIRTSDQDAHWPGAIALWNKLVESGDIEKREYQGLYCVGHESFVTEKDLIDGKCPDHGTPPEHLKEENYFFRLSRYTEEIKSKIVSDEIKIIPDSRKNEILSVLEDGLEDVSFSRPASKMSVGIPVPNDPSQKIYVWCDALANYISALGYGREDDRLFKTLWPADLHVIGKDILRFHAAIWPGMLLSAGLPLPKAILVHGFITSGGKKMSKTLGNVINPRILLEEYGRDAVRHFLSRHISPVEDGDITVEKFKEVYNADLANGLGNLVSRVMRMSSTHGIKLSPEERGDKASYEIFEPKMREYREALGNFRIDKASDAIWKLIAEADHYIQATQPFKLIKESREEGVKALKILLRYVEVVSRLIQPILPDTSLKIIELLDKGSFPEAPLFPRKD